ncbi:hypothetical protein [Variovorax sp. EL159]|nr:hypothetical protein [Variovorax sp. EL159]
MKNLISTLLSSETIGDFKHGSVLVEIAKSAPGVMLAMEETKVTLQ